MAKEKVYLAVDMGASSGRVVAGLLDGQQLRLEEVHRFENGPVRAAGRLYWDLLAQWSNIQDGLRRAATSYGNRVSSLGVDTWGVDFALLGSGDEPLGNPYHYRDARTRGLVEQAAQTVSHEDIFAETGLQFLEINTLYQLLAMRRSQSPLLEAAETFLMMPDLYNWLLTGEKVNELTDATTTQFFNPQTRDWSRTLLQKFDIPTRMLQSVAAPGTRLGKVTRQVASDTGLGNAEVVLPGAHDTASAVLAVPAASTSGANPDWCYISSGTWSLMGVEVPQPVINSRCRELNFTNEGGVGGTTRLLKNIAGLWLVQECRRTWGLAGRNYSWQQLTDMAASAPPLVSLIDPDDPSFSAPQDMAGAIRDFCHKTNQPAPDSEGAVIRCALESLAARYRIVLGWLEQLLGSHIETIHIVGGGTRNHQLCQMTADACNRPVIAGPVEATAIGNVMMQAISAGDVASIAQAREVISHSFDVQRFTPQNPGPWDEACGRLAGLTY